VGSVHLDGRTCNLPIKMAGVILYLGKRQGKPKLVQEFSEQE